MAQYRIQEETLTNLGDKIRVLNGSTETMTPLEMGSTLDTFNTEIEAELTEQDTLIADIMTALEGKIVPSGGTSYPDGAFIPVTNFTVGKQYALVAKIDGIYKYINITTYNDYTMNATEVSVTQGSGYVTFGSEPVLFTAAASGDGFTLANGSNYLHGTSSGGTALRVGTTTMVWTVDTSASGGFSDGKYLTKEDNSAVWLKYNDGTYDWSIKYETAGSFGYDREGRDDTYSTGFVSFILYEKAENQSNGTGGIDTSDATATAADILTGKTAYVNNEKITGTLEKGITLQKATYRATPTLGGSGFDTYVQFECYGIKSTSTLVNFAAIINYTFNGSSYGAIIGGLDDAGYVLMAGEGGHSSFPYLRTNFTVVDNYIRIVGASYLIPSSGSVSNLSITGIDTFRAEWYDN